MMEIDRLFSMRGKRVLVQSPEFPYGETIVDGFCEAGAHVWLCGENEEEMRRIGRKQTQHVKGMFLYAPSQEQDAERLAAQAAQIEGGIDAFVHISPPPMLPGWKHDFEEIYAALRRSQLYLMLTVKHIGALLAKQGRGSVLFITDYAALVGCNAEHCADDPACFARMFSLDYGFVKGSYVNYARQAAGFLGLHHVRCNAIAYAPMADGCKSECSEAFIRHSHLKRLAGERDVQAAALFLSSDAAGYITGVTLPVDGGYTAK